MSENNRNMPGFFFTGLGPMQQQWQGALGCHKIVRILSGGCALTRYKEATCQEIKGRAKRK
jgi:hypothetical protein